MPILTAVERVGRVIAGQYRLEAIISTGGMGVLFAAHDQVSARRVAVKMLKPVHELEAERVARFHREARIATSLRHPNIAEVFAIGTDENDVPFLVMELLQGRSLEQELEARGTFSMAEVLSIVLPIADALTTAHTAGVVHRDIKPANIFLCRGASGAVVPKLVDFGIAKTLTEEFDTQTGLLVGTPGYMAPEQAREGECGPQTDVWALGAVMYRCLCGHPPHTAGSVPELLAKLVRDPVPPLRASGVSKLACATVDRALARDPHQRYSSIAAFARALAAVGDADSGTATDMIPAFVSSAAPPSRGARQSRPAPPAANPPAPRTRWRSIDVRGIGAAAIAAVLAAYVLSPASGASGGHSEQRDEPPHPSRPAQRPSAEPAARDAKVTGALSQHAGTVTAQRPIVEQDQSLRAPRSSTKMPVTAAVNRSLSSGKPKQGRGAHASPSTLSAATVSEPRPTSTPPDHDEATGLPLATEW